jgi:threonine aldolase
MYSFNNDYSEGCHPEILKKSIDSNLDQSEGYGLDEHCKNAAGLIKSHVNQADADVHFIVGGTQTNMIAISSFLRPHEAAIAAETGHINVHETGAIEATGHKVLTAESLDGKLYPELIRNILNMHEDEHMVKPRLVYISNSTEIGTVYNKEELYRLSRFCREKGLILYLDGARLGSALCSKENDLTMAGIAEYTDAFYIGGTKNGALFGEALVITNDSLKEDFRYMIKQKGAMLAKGRILGVQFEELFKNGLYYELAGHANHMAERLKQEIDRLGYEFASNSSTNQLFPIFPDILIDKLKKKYNFSIQYKSKPGYSCVRLVTSWATKESEVSNFLEDLRT